jgi:hypothetical protein
MRLLGVHVTQLRRCRAQALLKRSKDVMERDKCFVSGKVEIRTESGIPTVVPALCIE